MKAIQSIVLLTIVFIACESIVFAYTGNTIIVPDASTYVLAPMGLAAVYVAHRHRKRRASLKQGVGAAYFIVKRLFDISAALMLIGISSPLFILIAIIVRFDSPGPVVYRRRVIGKHGKAFDMFKFRSMVNDAEAILKTNTSLSQLYQQKFKLEDDPRVTKSGVFLRKTSLDELPQLFNVLLGNMTFVGPRPIHEDEINKYGPDVERFKTVTPGITCLWQVCGRSTTSYETRVQMDMSYIDKRSIILDLWIVLSTLPAVLFKRGAY